jgi:aspartate aminotransferase-like enzyme
MLTEEGLPNAFARHRRLADTVRRPVAADGLAILFTAAQEVLIAAHRVTAPTTL